MSRKNEIDELQEPIYMAEEGIEQSPSLEGRAGERLDKETIEAIKKFTDEDSGGDLSISSILGGDILMSRWMVKQVVFVMFVVALCILYTANRYSSQQESILIDSLRTQLQDVKYNVLTQSSELMNITRQSNVEEMLRHTKDSTLRNPITPPYLIRASEDYPQAKPRQVQEVLVGSEAKADGATAKDSTKNTEKSDSAKETEKKDTVKP